MRELETQPSVEMSAFLGSVRAYLSFIAAQSAQLDVDRHLLFRRLVDLQSSIHRLQQRAHVPTLDDLLADVPEVNGATPTNCTQHKQLSSNLNGVPFDYYYDVPDPHAHPAPPEVLMGSLVDDLVDIYLDLADGLAYFDSGRLAEAEWQWRFSFNAHWGTHLSAALLALWRWDGERGGPAGAG